MTQKTDAQTERFDAANGFNPRPVAEHLQQHFHLWHDLSGHFWIYDDQSGLWMADAEPYLEQYMRTHLLGDGALRRHCINEVLADIKSLSYKRSYLPDPPLHLIPFTNGVLNLDTNELIPYQPSHYFTFRLPVAYNADAKCPLIDRLFQDFVDEPIELYELVAFCLWRRYDARKIFFLYGKGGNGKSVFLNILEMLLGKQNCASIDLHHLAASRFETANLHKRHVALCSELRMEELKRVDVIKWLTGKDAVRAEEKYKKPFSFHNYAKIIVSCNHLPQILSLDDALLSRIHIITFPRTFAGTPQEDRQLLSRITTQELEGLAARAVEHLHRLRANNFTFTHEPSVDEVREMFDRLSSPLTMFITEHFIEDPLGVTPKELFNTLFKAWQTKRRMPTWSDKLIAMKMRQRGFEEAYRKAEPAHFEPYKHFISFAPELEELLAKRWPTRVHYWCGVRPKLPENH